ncbi:MAG TPA: alpha/beta hydrolase domain-containing protein [Solirubrobacteraceae bacterium]
MLATPIPTVSPIEGIPPVLVPAYPLETVGYVEQEFLVEGVARSFALTEERTSDGRWSVREDAEAPYVTRIIVRRPIDPAAFSGTVAVEWNNVSAGMDVSPDWSLLQRELTGRGHIWVGVSAQKVGIDGGGMTEGIHLKLLAPDRYGLLKHPGDAWSFDIFSQVGALLRSPSAAALGVPVAERLIALGESQSAFFLVTYINAIDPEAQVYDGFFVHGRGASGVSLEGAWASSRQLDEEVGAVLRAVPERIRDDARVPVLVLQSETDVVVLGGGAPAQPDGEHLRLWEMAGASHFDTYLVFAAAQDDGRLAPAAFAELMKPTTQVMFATTDSPVNSGPQQHYIAQAALDALVAWAAGGPVPPRAPRLELDADAQLACGEHGIARGGIRTPWVDVPTATLSGLGQSGDGFAVLAGRTDLFDPQTLQRLYPGGRADYLDRFAESLDATITAGFLRPEDRAEILALAQASYDALG